MAPKNRGNGNAGSEGVQFQVSLLTVFLLNAFRRRLDNWKLSTENEKAGKLDDVVLEWSEGDILLQAKSKTGRLKRVTMENLMSVNSEHSEFSLPKYFWSYREIMNKFRIKNIIICTNIGMDKKILKYLESQCVCPQSMLYHNDRSYTFYTFKEDILSDLKENAKKYLEQNLKNTNLSESEITDENLRDFLNHLHFYSNYPSGTKLKNRMDQILTELDLRCTISFSDIHSKVMDYFQGNKKDPIDVTYVKGIFSEIWTDNRWKFFEECNVRFKNNDFELIKQDDLRKQIFYINIESGYLLQEIKLYRALQSDKNNILYMNSDDNAKAQEFTIEAFSLPIYVFLIIVSPTSIDETCVEEMSAKFRNILNKSKYKKIVLVADGDNHLLKQFDCDNDNFETIDGTIHFKDLKRESQKKLLKNKNIEFQGKFVCLEELFETQKSDYYEKIITPDILEKLIRKETIRVGQEVNNVSRYYVNRTIIRHINENDTHRQIRFSEENIFEEVKDKIILITDSAGMGKTTILVKLAMIIKQQNPRLWVIRVVLNQHTTYFKEVLGNGEAVDVIDLLHFNVTKSSASRLENVVFTLQDKIVLMLDGVDEISPDYTKLIVDLLVRSNSPNIAKIFVTARPHMTGLLETRLQVKSFTLQPFTKDNQIDFLTDYWTFNLGLDEVAKEKCKQYAKILISKIDENARFAAIPLQVRMMAEIFQEEYLSAVDAVPELQTKLNIAKLYELFIARKKDEFVARSNPTGNPTSNELLANTFNESLVLHRKLALNTILHTSDAKLFTLHKEKVKGKKNKEEMMLKMGIVQKLDDKLHFINRTFAEYFVAESIVEELELPNENFEFQRFLIDTVLVEDSFSFMRVFLDNFLHKVVDSLPSDTLQEYTSHDYYNHWLKWRNFLLLHHLAQEGHIAILRFILKCVDFKLIRGQEIHIMELFEAETDTKTEMYMYGNTLRALKHLLRKGGINIRDENGDTPLYYAVRAGHLAMVKYLVGQGANITSEKWSESSLNCAAHHGHFDIIKFLMDQQEGNTKKKDWTILEISIEEKYKHITNYFLDKIIKNGVNRKKPVLAYAAANLGRMDILENLVEQGLDVNARVEDKVPLIFSAAQGQQLDVIKFLVEKGADVNNTNDLGDTCLPFCMSEPSFIPTVELLISLEIDVNNRGYKDRTALHIAVDRGNLDMVKLLVENGADINCRDEERKTPVLLAAAKGNLDILKFLVENGGDINMADKDGNTALHWAACGDDLDIVNFFRSRNVDFTVQNNNKQNAIHMAAKSGNGNMIKYLIELGVDLNVKDNCGHTALHIAAQFSPEVIELLVALGIDVNVADNLGRTPLHLTCEYKYMHGIEALLTCNADVDVPDNNGRTALFYIFDMIINVRNSRDSNYRNYLHCRALHKLDMVKMLVTRYSADINFRDNKGRTILHEVVSSSSGQLNFVRFLVEQLRANVDVRDLEGRTPLHIAVERCVNVAKYLVEQGADTTIKDGDGHTAADFVRKSGHLDLLQHLGINENTKDDDKTRVCSSYIICCLRRYKM